MGKMFVLCDQTRTCTRTSVLAQKETDSFVPPRIAKASRTQGKERVSAILKQPDGERKHVNDIYLRGA